MTPINYNAPWHTLKHVCVGATYNQSFYQPIKNSKVRNSLQKIAQETEEDFQNLISVLESFNVKVSRPVIDKNKSILDFVSNDGSIHYKNSQSFTLIPRPPMQPRDSILVINNKLLTTTPEATTILNCLNDGTVIDYINPQTNKNHYSLPPSVHFDAPLVTVVGDTLIIDCRDQSWLHQYFTHAFSDYKIKPVYIGGHNDAVFSLIKPGLLISTHHHTNYSDSLPGWQVYQVENQSWNAIPGWRKLKHSNINRWWVPESINNQDFCDFIDSWLNDWVGFVQETVFDVNVLSINPSTVLVNNYNKDLFSFLKKHNVEAIIVPFRHRFFWDGGLHCITSDLYREGEKERYV
jgi:hypothetical protein